MKRFSHIAYFSSFFLLFLFLLIGNTGGLKAQSPTSANPYLQYHFLKDSLKVGEGNFYFNSLLVTNTSAKALTLSVGISQPCFVTLISNAQQQITIQPNESESIPIRFSGNSQSNCATNWQNLEVSLVEPAVNLHIAASFALKPSLSYKWKVSLPQPTIIITEKDRKINFTIKIENTGNAEDHYRLSFANEFSYLNKKEPITLAAGATASEIIELKLDAQESKQFKNKEITIFLENDAKERKSIIQKISKLENVFRENGDNWKRIPLTFELNQLGLLGATPSVFLRILGDISLSKNRSLKINIQTPSLTKGRLVASTTPVIEYTTPKWDILAGSFYETNQFVVYGDGVKIRRYDKKKNWYEAGYNKSAFSNSDQLLAKTSHYIGHQITYLTNSIANFDHEAKSNGFVSMHRLEWKALRGLELFAEVGGGVQNINTPLKDTSLSGKSIAFGLQKKDGNFQGSLNFFRYSRSFPGVYKGYTHYFHDFRWAIKKITIGSYLDLGNLQPFILKDSAFLDKFSNSLSNISGRVGFSAKNLNVILYPGVISQKQDSLNSFQSYMKKVTSTISLSLFKQWQLSLNSTAGYISVSNDKGAPPIFSLTSFMSVQSSYAGAFIRYDVGPYYYNDIRKYKEDHIQKTIVQVAPFVHKYFTKWNLDVRTQVNISISKPTEATTYLGQTDFHWQNVEKAVSAGCNINVNFSDTRNSYLNLYLRKTMNVPVMRRRSYKNFKVFLFKDTNGDGKKDEGESPISNAYLILDKTLLQTNDKGEIEVLNYAGGSLSIDLSAINNVAGWVPAQGFKQTATINGKKEIYIAFKKSRLISGKLILDKDEKSTLDFDVSGIRITALGKNGNTFSTLTGGDGTYYLNVVDGEYSLFINENVFDETFKVIDPVRNVDLINNRQISANFVVRQKRREMIIKKQ